MVIFSLVCRCGYSAAGLALNSGFSSAARSSAGNAAILTHRSIRLLNRLQRKAIFLLYRVLQALVSPVFLLYLLWRSARNGAYLRSLSERFGWLPAQWRQTVPGAIWLHAVSVGEALAAVPLIDELRRAAPETP